MADCSFPGAVMPLARLIMNESVFPCLPIPQRRFQVSPLVCAASRGSRALGRSVTFASSKSVDI